MPRNYKRKTERQSWNKTSMEKAIAAVKNNEMGWLRASKILGVPQATLRRHCNKQNKSIAPATKGMGRFRKVFSHEMERELVNHIKLFETRLFGFTRKEVLELAYQYADINKIPHNFNNEKKTRVSGAESPSIIQDSPSGQNLQKTTALIPINVISPVPKGVYVTGQGKRKPRKKPTVLLLTSTPNMEEIKIKSAPPPVSKKRARKTTKVLNFSSSSDEDFSSLQTSTVADFENDDCPCIYCNDLFFRSKPKEVWLQCLSCRKWAHASCADVSTRTKSFICELCQ